MNKKLQVFVSSTYTDLIEERQAAVQAILDAGHIPAGMELFKAGNESQLKTIYKWIDESDVYMLILGGRYGSIEEKSGKSYTQLEYEYALSKDIPVFTVVLSDLFLTQKITSLGLKNATEQIAPDKYQTFKTLVMSKIVREVDDYKDIKIAIYTTLNEFVKTYNLIGWNRSEENFDSIQLLKNNTYLVKQNSLLNDKIRKSEEIITKLQTKLKLIENGQFGEYYFTKLLEIFKTKKFPIVINNIIITPISALDIFIKKYESFCNGTIKYSNTLYKINPKKYFLENVYHYFMYFNLIEVAYINGKKVYIITKLGKEFYQIIKLDQ